MSDSHGWFTNNLTAQHTRVWTGGPDLEIAMDLNVNLRSRSKQDNAYLDARDLADGRIAELSLVQIDDDRLIDAVVVALQGFGDTRPAWYLNLELQGDHTFAVEPEFKTMNRLRILNLRVIEPA